MSYIFDIAANNYIPLASHHTFGRLAESVDTPIDKPYVSKLHAAIEWNGNQWRIKNLGLNGTWLNGEPLTEHQSTPLTVDDVIHFAKLTDSGFRIMDLTPPSDMLWPLDASPADQKPLYLSRYNLLPDSLNPELAIYINQETHIWQTESIDADNSTQTRLKGGDIVAINNSRWKFIPADVYVPTEVHINKSQKLDDMMFVFNMSLDEETTALSLETSQKILDLGVRSHHYLLIQLIRHHAEDSALGLDDKSSGWIYTDKLAAELGLDITHINIQIFRLRKQFSDGLPSALNLQCLLERRGGKIRFGCNKYRVYKGSTLILESACAATD